MRNYFNFLIINTLRNEYANAELFQTIWFNNQICSLLILKKAIIKEIVDVK